MEKRETKPMKIPVEYAVLVLCMCVTVGLFCIPIVFYYISPYLDSTTQAVINTNVSSSISSCDPVDSTSSSSWGIIAAGQSMECVPYTESVCLSYLTEWNQCLFPDQNDVITGIDNADQLVTLEQEVASMKALLDAFPDCQFVMVPFLCHYYFPLTSSKDCNSVDRVSYTVTQDECGSIRDGVCAGPWQLAIQFGFQQSLPDCSSLPFADTNDTNVVVNASISQSSVNSSNEVNITSGFSCRDDFLSVNGSCLPRCDKFSGYSDKSTFAVLFFEVSCSVFTVVASVVAFIVAIYQRKKMFTFPSFFFLLVLIDLFVGDLLIVILSMDRYTLSCSSISLGEAIENPTPFCITGGVLYYYSFTNLTFWWFFHVCYFAYEVHFPFHARRMRALGRTKYIATVLVILGFVLPLPGIVLIPLIFDGRNYRITRFPPTICTPDEETWFYTFFLVTNVVACICTCLLISVLWVIRTQLYSTKKRYKKSNNSFTITTAEKKILLVFIYLSGFTVFVITANTILAGNSRSIQRELTDYFVCEITGHEPGKCDRKEFERLLYPELTIPIYIIVALIPVILLNFITNVERYVKRIVTKYTLYNSTKKSNSTVITNDGESVLSSASHSSTV